MPEVYLRTLGCDKNTADSTALAGMLREKGWRLTDNPAGADALILNTCGFILSAKEESIAAILELSAYREGPKAPKLLVLGCLVQRYEDELACSLPEVDAWFGVYQMDDVLSWLDGTMPRDTRCHAQQAARMRPDEHAGPLVPGGHTAYLKIADGCDTGCTYCAIPAIKGPYVSRHPDVLVREARSLEAAGIQEMVLVAQDTTAWGRDLPEPSSLAQLIRALLDATSIPWIRILYAYADAIDDALLTLIHEEPRICDYLDIPLQHADDDVLRRMGRKQTCREITRTIERIRKRCPGIVLRSTFITGFPGETPEQFARLLSFVRAVRLNWVGAFPYSLEEGTPAACLPEQLPDEVKQERYGVLMGQQQTITQAWLETMVGTVHDVLIEERIDEKRYVGRTAFMAPDVDGAVVCTSDKPLGVGAFVKVRIEEATEYDLMGEVWHDDI